MTMRWAIFCGAALALAACGDDTTTDGSGGATGDGGSKGDGGSSGDGGGPGQGGAGSTSSAGGGTTSYEEACATFCEGVQTASDQLGCGTIAGCEVDYCDGPTAACAAEQNALYLCYGSELEAGNTAGCFCEGDGEIECEGLCATENAALDACEDPLLDACLEVDDALFAEGCESFAFYNECRAQGDAAVGAGCGDAFYALTACLAASAASCTCTETDVECDGVCPDETEGLETCLGG